MKILELDEERIPQVTGCADSFAARRVEAHLDTDRIMVIPYEGVCAWCRIDEGEEIRSYWPGKYLPRNEHFA